MHKYLLLYFVGFFLISCGPPPFERRIHLVTDIIDGNTIEVDNGVHIKLLGIQETKRSADYLQNNILNQRIRIVYDSKMREKVTTRFASISAYVVTIDRRSLNGELIRQKLSGLEEMNLHDSLEVFRSYLHGNSPGSNSQVMQKASTSSFTELVINISPSIFIIYKVDEFGSTSGQGTGFFISSSGIGVSNYHVFEGGSSWYVKTNSGDIFEVDKILKYSQNYDFIVFQLAGNNNNFPCLELDDKLPSVGEEIFVIGNPQGLESTVTRGIVSAIRSEVPFENFIQIDAAISPGSSGSPLLNLNGKVIGIATATFRGDCQNCNFALKISVLKDVLYDIDLR